MNNSERLEAIRQAVNTDPRTFPNAPGAQEFGREAEAQGFQVQMICDAGGSTGAYYEVLALFPPEGPAVGEKPVALIFEDYSGPTQRAWLIPVPEDA